MSACVCGGSEKEKQDSPGSKDNVGEQRAIWDEMCKLMIHTHKEKNPKREIHRYYLHGK